ncbi:PREDICTED: 28 kDa heat- and acid-stable phosphoprotein-like [Amphimedon queenslandica]|uniref:Casein kinase substrate phosphoprotein PP28 domain-containing protein n=1 Tax=Amphimedon queenslandica TaxID=400682 RepID=A0A1X7UK17_AMPQE|nr:PREDICTED: 28 kDa heat- and acid-stable phosphoprotein-like [Amphimedon queenslandica]|eukprot:XP_003387651.2 PREDICTED: 28 kDa heat- and acid-stable phosphoprotein-like [Amphimedon queenslandica]
MPKGKPKGGHKGRMRRFVTEEEMVDQEEKRKREQEWKKKKGLAPNRVDEDEDDVRQEDEKESEKDDDISFGRGASGGHGLEEEEEESSEEEEESSDDEYIPKSKGVEGLIEIENPNRVQQKGKKVQSLDVNAKVELSRKEREEIEKQRAAASYRKKHEAGMTEEAQRDLARLALIRQQREEAAKKKEAAKKMEASKK